MEIRNARPAETKPKTKKSNAEQLAALKQREAAIKARIARLEHKAKAQSRKDDTRMKILVGAAVLADAALHPETAQWLGKVLGRAITAQRDIDFLIGRLDKALTADFG